ncbi:MAG: Ppx/GppA phosphatase family protein [Bacteroidota bacterium]
MRVATIDIGTNTCLLLIADVRVADVTPDGQLEVVCTEGRYTRLGQGVDGSKNLHPDAIERVMTTLATYRQQADAHGAEAIVIGATSASRDAANRQVLVDRARDELGLDYRVISGEEEARLSFLGALSAFPNLDRATVFDIGGGSTELITGHRTDDGIVIEHRASLDVGAVRLTERCFASLPPAAHEIDAARRLVTDALNGVPLDAHVPLLGSSGTTRALAKLVAPDDPWQDVPAATVHVWSERLLTLTADEVLALNPAIMSGRSDVFAAGALILNAILDAGGFAAYRPSPRGLRYGLALDWASRQY